MSSRFGVFALCLLGVTLGGAQGCKPNSKSKTRQPAAFAADKLVAHLESAIAKGEQEVSKLNKDVLKIEGMSSPKIRHFLNNLGSLAGAHYLEVGTWKGSTFIASLFGNQATIGSAIGVDNWSGPFGAEPKKGFVANCAKFLVPKKRFTFVEGDCFKLDLAATVPKPISIYFYDGRHSFEDHVQAFTYFDSVFDQVFIAVVDDWNYPRVQKATREAFKKLRYEVVFERALPADMNGDIKKWWNGLYVAVLKKPSDR